MSYLILSFKRLSFALAVLALAATPSFAKGPNSGPGHGGGGVVAPEPPTVPAAPEAPTVQAPPAAEPPAPPAAAPPAPPAAAPPAPPAPEPAPAPAAEPPAPPAAEPLVVNAPADPGPAATPEPATLVLLTTGAAGSVIARWRKRSK